MFNQAPGYIDSIRKTLEENHQLRKELEVFAAEKAQQIKATIKQQAVEMNGVLVIRLMMEIPADQVKNIALQLRGECSDNVLFVAGSSFENKPTLSIMLGKELVDKGLNAGKLIREAAQFIQGNGGGQAHFAMAGGKDTAGLQQAVQFVVEAVTSVTA